MRDERTIKMLVVIMNIEQSVNQFLDFCLYKNPEEFDLGDLIRELDMLVVSTCQSKFEYDDNDYPEPPDKDYAALREAISRRFPELGFYQTVGSEVSDEENVKVLIGDAVDDLVDIIGDLQDVKWNLENTTINNAKWHFEFSYRSHWGFHLRELQLFLHRQWW